MNLIGKIVVVDHGNAGAAEYVCVRQMDHDLALVKTRSDYGASYKPVTSRRENVVSVVEAPWAVRDVMFNISKMLTYKYVVSATHRFRVQAHRTIQMLKAAYELVEGPVPKLARRAVDVVGPNDLFEVLVVLEDNGKFMLVASEEGAIVEVKKDEWVFGDSKTGLPALDKLLATHPDAWVLQEYRKRWSCHIWN